VAAKKDFDLNKKISCNVQEIDFDFVVTPSAYINFMNDVQSDDKITPMHEFCMVTVNPEKKDSLFELLKHPVVITNTFNKLMKEYGADVSVSIKK
jgi:hypothetical protein